MLLSAFHARLGWSGSLAFALALSPPPPLPITSRESMPERAKRLFSALRAPFPATVAVQLFRSYSPRTAAYRTTIAHYPQLLSPARHVLGLRGEERLEGYFPRVSPLIPTGSQSALWLDMSNSLARPTGHEFGAVHSGAGAGDSLAPMGETGPSATAGWYGIYWGWTTAAESVKIDAEAQ